MATKLKALFHQHSTAWSHYHWLMVGLLIAIVSFVFLLTPSKPAQAKRMAIPLIITPSAPAQWVAEPDLSPSTPAESPWMTIQVRDGDNLSTLFQRAKLREADLQELLNSIPDARHLTTIYPKQQFLFQIDPDNHRLQALKHVHNPLKTTLYQRADDQSGYTISDLEAQLNYQQHYRTATINSSLYNAAIDANLSQGLVMEMADIYSGVMDFVYDVRSGDHFTVLYEQAYIDDQPYGQGKILAAQFTNRGKTYQAYRYEHENSSVAYYDEQGISMHKAFLRAPVDFTRISSHFNPRRLHPIFKTVKPHRGIDYAAATGTPVFAAGDGRIIASDYTKANGNYVVIQHNDKYTTKYLHLNKRHVKKGQRVTQRQIIGTVGATGYVTAPHLHYEFLVHGVHKNPRTVAEQLPSAKRIDDSEKSRFLAHIGHLQYQLAALSQDDAALAANEKVISTSPLDG